MNFFGLPKWSTPHLFNDRKFAELSQTEVTQLRERLAHFNVSDPEITVAIPAWNEENNIFRMLSSLASNNTKHRTEIIVIDNNSTDSTRGILDTLGVKTFIQTIQGTQFARQMGLEKARGKYFLCADSDTLYPPDWIDLMVEPLMKDPNVSCVYGRHSFVPPKGQSRFGLAVYELLGEIAVGMRTRQNKEYINVYGYNMGFETKNGLETGGFKINNKRIYANAKGADFQNESEDGKMAVNLMSVGKLRRVASQKAIVFTSPRRLMDDGSIFNAFVKRFKHQVKTLN
ncbi:glycosyltransferase family 2 protein [Dyadobacter sp. CY261]|uniref:glycosyltransferase family A protein n=1 Tax=Dyadobacter sp. CY261 TaxID=2907203 RepID=UPI001F315C47|nr:glycosyltransferase family A protein [Dyadobacter sp. CY261]MCF0068941.1 glycosyltransferase family 2 protein [Dyadobacter sp. CY261]